MKSGQIAVTAMDMPATPAIPRPPRLPAALATAVAATLLASCAGAPEPREPSPPPPPRQIAQTGTATNAIANLASASGSLVSGRMELVQAEDGVRVRGLVGGLVRNGAHGLQVHERGDCGAVDARSAGGYYDPLAGAQQDGAVGASPGRIVAGPDGIATVDLLVRGAVLGGGADNDILGRSLLVLGATPGAISARVACGIITVSK